MSTRKKRRLRQEGIVSSYDRAVHTAIDALRKDAAVRCMLCDEDITPPGEIVSTAVAQKYHDEHRKTCNEITQPEAAERLRKSVHEWNMD